jgi:uncharacterized Zn finger protein (UPF0148 family)
MSALDILQRINRKLDQGWKMSDQTCPVCKTIIVGNLTTKEFYCCKCEMPAKIVFADQSDEEDYDVEVISPNKYEVIDDSKSKEKEITPTEYENMIFKREAERRKTDDLSKKMGELLLKGWAMLEDTCGKCLFPIMRSKQGEFLCVGCGPVDMNKKETPKKTVEPEMMPPKQITPQKTVEMKKEEPKKEQPKNVSFEKKEEMKPMKREHHHPHHEKRHHHHEHEEHEHPHHDHHDHHGRSASEDEGECGGRRHGHGHKHMKMMMMKGEMMKKCMEFGRINESLDFYSTLSEGLTTELKRMMSHGVINNMSHIEKLLEMQMKVDQAKKELFPKFHGKHHHKQE